MGRARKVARMPPVLLSKDHKFCPRFELKPNWKEEVFAMLEVSAFRPSVFDSLGRLDACCHPFSVPWCSCFLRQPREPNEPQQKNSRHDGIV